MRSGPTLDCADRPFRGTVKLVKPVKCSERAIVSGQDTAMVGAISPTHCRSDLTKHHHARNTSRRTSSTRPCWDACWIVRLPGRRESRGGPATPSYVGVEQTIARVRADWEKGGRRQPERPRLEHLFDAIRNELRTYSAAGTRANGSARWGSFYRMWGYRPGGTGRRPAEVRNALACWLTRAYAGLGVQVTQRFARGFASRRRRHPGQSRPLAEVRRRRPRRRFAAYENAANVPDRLKADGPAEHLAGCACRSQRRGGPR